MPYLPLCYHNCTQLVLLHKTSSSLFLPLGHEETFVFVYHPTRFHSFRILGLFIVFS